MAWFREELFQEDELEKRKQAQKEPKNKVKAGPSDMVWHGVALLGMAECC